jgi:ornithine cyclodeaminase
MTMRILNARHIAALVPLKGWIDTIMVFCYTEHAIDETGDLINPLQSGSIKPSQVIPSGRLITGEVERPASDVQIWNSVGMALFDLAAAVMLYQEARTQNIGQMVDV